MNKFKKKLSVYFDNLQFILFVISKLIKGSATAVFYPVINDYICILLIFNIRVMFL